MKTMTHTDAQRKAWIASKTTGKSRRAQKAMGDAAAISKFAKLVKLLRSKLTTRGLSLYSSKRRVLGSEAADVWLV